MSARVSALPRLRFAENAIPTRENSRSTAADVAGHPRYCRAITATFGNSLECCTTLFGMLFECGLHTTAFLGCFLSILREFVSTLEVSLT